MSERVKERGKLLRLRRESVVVELSDQALLSACAVGDAAALGALFDRYHADVRRFLGHLAGTDERDLEDLVQATFLEVHRSAARFRGLGAVKTWIFGIAVNVVRHHVRSEVRRRTFTDRLADHPVAPAPAPDTHAERRQLAARLEQALRALPEPLRSAFVACDLEGLPGADAARVLGIREGTLWRRLHEARRSLRAALDGHDTGGAPGGGKG